MTILPSRDRVARRTPARQARLRTVVLLGASLAGLGVTVSAAELQQATIDAFNRYVKATEARQASSAPFLWFEGLAQVPRSKAEERLRRGEFVIDRLRTTDAGRAIETPDGLVHHWIGVVLVKGVSIDQAVALLQDYDRHGEIYTPNVARSKLLSRRGDDFKLSLRFFMEKATIGVVINSEHEARFTRHSPDRVSSRIYSTRIVEVEHPDTRREREKPEGRDEGYLWRLNSYWRFQQRPEGVYIQCESITLTRDIPLGLGWLLGGFVTAIPQETLSFTLETTRKTLLARAKTGA